MNCLSRLVLALVLLPLCGCAPARKHESGAVPVEPAARQPVVLGRSEVKHFIAACKQERLRLSKEFGTDVGLDFNWRSNDSESAYAPRCQAFALPNGQTLFAFDTPRVVGAVVFDSSSKHILQVLPWSRTLNEGRGDEQVVFDRTFYRLQQTSSGVWSVTALVFAIVGDKRQPRYETWEFQYGGAGGGHTRRYTMTPYRWAPD